MIGAIDLNEPRLRDAIAELQALVSQHYPGTTFSVDRGDEGEGVLIFATVDVDDPDEVVDLVIDRVLDLQLEEGLPIHVVPVRTPERQTAMLEDRRARGSWPRVPLSALG